MNTENQQLLNFEERKKLIEINRDEFVRMWIIQGLSLFALILIGGIFTASVSINNNSIVFTSISLFVFSSLFIGLLIYFYKKEQDMLIYYGLSQEYIRANRRYQIGWVILAATCATISVLITNYF